jgi:hypothetical protein
MRIRLSAHLLAPPSLWLAGLLTLLAAAVLQLSTARKGVCDEGMF